MLVLKILEIFTVPIIVLVFTVISILVWTPPNKDENGIEIENKK